jgi:hypothetical protein
LGRKGGGVLMQLSLFEVPCQSQSSQSAIASVLESIAKSKSPDSTISNVGRVVNGLKIGYSVNHKTRLAQRIGIVGGFSDVHTWRRSLFRIRIGRVGG